jgi:prophage DNA circulation protein
MYTDRLTEATITTPDNEQYTFDYTDVSKETNAKTSTYEFSDTPGALVQHYGNGATSFPLTFFIAGVDYDIDAKDFEDSLAEPGVTVLEHPLYGIKNVVPTAIRREDRLRSGGGQAVFNITFIETIIPVAPGSEVQTLVEIEVVQTELAEINIDAYLAIYQAITDFIDGAARVLDFVNNVRSAVNTVLNTVASIQQTFDQIANEITSNIEFLLNAPSLLAASLQRLVDTPARLIASVKQRIDIYKGIQAAILLPPTGNNTQDNLNQKLEKQLLATAVLSAMVSVNLTPDPVSTNAGDTGGVGGVGATGTVAVDPLGEEVTEF